VNHSAIALALILLWGCAARKYIPAPNEELYGTWTNEKGTYQKTDTCAGGWKNFALAADTQSGAEREQAYPLVDEVDPGTYPTTIDPKSSNSGFFRRAEN
jgi:hypothetical protein